MILKATLMILQLHGETETDLSKVGETSCLSRLLPCARKGGEQEGGKDPDDGDHREQFQQGECTAPSMRPTIAERLGPGRSGDGGGVSHETTMMVTILRVGG